ncbi:MAG: hypothetical protein FJW32_27375 [Acidobacteria bacterium]|nr:hypothetical protein [Acidobacteriota bacterium]
MATISECLRAAERLAEIERLRDEVESGLTHAVPILDAWADALTTAEPLRKRDGLRIVATVWRSWRFTPHSSGAYLDGTVGIVIERSGYAPEKYGTAHVRYSATMSADGVTCPPWEAVDGTLRTFTTHTQGVALPEAAARLVADHVRATFGGIPATVADVWAECFAYHLTDRVHEVARGRAYAHDIARTVENYGQAVTA